MDIQLLTGRGQGVTSKGGKVYLNQTSNEQREDEDALPRVVKVCGSDERSSDKTYYKETKDDDIRPQHSKQGNE